MPDSESIGADELALLATAIALTLAKALTVDQLNVYGNFVVAVGGLMLVIAAQEEALKNQSEEPEADIKQQIKDMQKQLEQLLKQESAPK